MAQNRMNTGFIVQMPLGALICWPNYTAVRRDERSGNCEGSRGAVVGSNAVVRAAIMLNILVAASFARDCEVAA